MAESTRDTDIRLLRYAVLLGMQESDDPRTKNGAIIEYIAGGMYTSIGAANSFPTGPRGRVKVTDERLDRAVKLTYIEHAERGVIYAAAQSGVKTHYATMYCPWFACVDCARAIICAGIIRVVGLQKLRDITPERWQQTIALSDGLLREAGVQIELLPDELGVDMLFDEQLVRV
jgi:dCMP deaminase